MAIVFMVFFFIHCGFTLTSMYATHPLSLFCLHHNLLLTSLEQ